MKHIIKFIGVCLFSGLLGMFIVGQLVSRMNLETSPIQSIKLRYKVKEKSFVDVPQHVAIIRLVDGKGDFFCSGFVVDAVYAVTAAHCLVDELGFLTKRTLRIESSEGELLTTAKAAGLNNRVDYGIITGDFSNFKHLDMTSSVSFFDATAAAAFVNLTSPEYKICGYPQGQKKLFCASFAPTSPYFSQIMGIGQAFPGMSGGPVLNATGEAVGIVSAMSDGGAIITPVIGILGNFGVEQ